MEKMCHSSVLKIENIPGAAGNSLLMLKRRDCCHQEPFLEFINKTPVFILSHLNKQVNTDLWLVNTPHGVLILSYDWLILYMDWWYWALIGWYFTWNDNTELWLVDMLQQHWTVSRVWGTTREPDQPQLWTMETASPGTLVYQRVFHTCIKTTMLHTSAGFICSADPRDATMSPGGRRSSLGLMEWMGATIIIFTGRQDTETLLTVETLLWFLPRSPRDPAQQVLTTM